MGLQGEVMARINIWAGKVVTTVYQITYKCCEIEWTQKCTCVCDDTCKGCGKLVPPTKFGVHHRFEETDL